jgi:hypothetical protein
VDKGSGMCGMGMWREAGKERRDMAVFGGGVRYQKTPTVLTKGICNARGMK